MWKTLATLLMYLLLVGDVTSVTQAQFQQVLDTVFTQTAADYRLTGFDPRVSLRPNFRELVTLPRREEMVQKEARLAEMSLDVLKKLGIGLKHPVSDILMSEPVMDAISRRFRKYCTEKISKFTCDGESPYRTINGSCNNLLHPTWGMAGELQERYLPAAYEDGVNNPREMGKDGKPLPNPRKISNIVHKSVGEAPVHRRLSAMMMTWGQFIKHDIISTPSMRDVSGSSYDCCGKDKNKPVCIPINVPQPDPTMNETCMSVVRSSPAVGPACSVGARQHLNKVTAFLDGSAVYGSSKAEEKELRAWKNGLLREGAYELLPPSGKNDCIKKQKTDQCQLAGDERANIIPSVSALHTLFMREHNRIARNLIEVNGHWTDERLYQETRKIIGALLQHITYHEYIPMVLGHDLTEYFGLIEPAYGYNHVYNETVNPGIRNVFASAAYRFGHSTIPSKQTYIGPQFEKRRGVPIEDTYHKPYYLLRYRNYGYDGLMRWLITDPVPNSDRQFVSGVRDHLFKNKYGGFDLAALNIQRGRDHGIPSYNSWRQWCGLSVVKNFGANETGFIDHDEENAELLELAYGHGHPDDVDLYSGALTELHVEGGNVGPTFACIIANQFRAIKYGDRFWYENMNYFTGFTQEQLDSIKEITLGKVICSNLDIPDIQRDVFLTPMIDTHLRRHILCEHLPDLNFFAWIDKKEKWASPVKNGSSGHKKNKKSKIPKTVHMDANLAPVRKI